MFKLNLDKDVEELVEASLMSDEVTSTNYYIIKLMALQVQEYRKFNGNLEKLLEKLDKK